MASFDSFSLDARYALRSLRRAPVFTAVVLLTLVAGVAVVTTIFSYLNAIYFAELPYHDANRIVRVGQRLGGFGVMGSGPAATLVRQYATSFERVTVYKTNYTSIVFGGEGRGLAVLHVDSGFVSMFALRPAAGRVISRDEFLGAVPVTMISKDLWDAVYGGDTSAVGRLVRIHDRDHRIVGVLPAGFRYPWQTDAIVPLDENKLIAGAADEHDFFILGKLRPAVDLLGAQNEMRVLFNRLPSQRKGTNSLMVQEGPLDRRGQAFLPLPGIFLGAGVFVLLIACGNVANLFLARSAERETEIAIRASLGASRARLVRQSLTENFLLAGIAAVVGTAVAPMLVRVGLSFVPTQGFPSWFRVTTDYRVLLFALGVLVVVTFAAGLSPALQGTRLDLLRSLKGAGSASGVTRRVMRTNSRALVVQLALGIALFVASALLVRSYQHLTNVDVGYPADRIAVVQPYFDPVRYKEPATRLALVERVFADVEGSANISSSAVQGQVSGLRAPTVRKHEESGRGAWDARIIPDHDTTRAVRVRPPGARYLAVTDRYFDVLDLRISRGRGFVPADVPGSSAVAVISASAASALWPNANPLGRTIQVAAHGEPLTIIGVVDDVFDVRGGRDGFTNEPLPSIYVSTRQAYAQNPVLLARGPGDVRALHAFLKARMVSADPALLIGREVTLAHELDLHLMVTRVFGGLIASFAIVALVLSVMGTYGVVAFGVARRTREIGIRMALGGTDHHIVKHMMRGTMGFVAVGLAFGLVLGLGLGRLLKALLFGVSAFDPAAYVGVSIVFIIVTSIGCWLPARRATRVDPVVALRAE